jgi:hypothetical protein
MHKQTRCSGYWASKGIGLQIAKDHSGPLENIFRPKKPVAQPL